MVLALSIDDESTTEELCNTDVFAIPVEMKIRDVVLRVGACRPALAKSAHDLVFCNQSNTSLFSDKEANR